jgi:hypothetical protein
MTKQLVLALVHNKFDGSQDGQPLIGIVRYERFKNNVSAKPGSVDICYSKTTDAASSALGYLALKGLVSSLFMLRLEPSISMSYVYRMVGLLSSTVSA